MTRRDLTLPLRFGPWWVGMLMLIPFIPLLLVVPITHGLTTFGKVFVAVCRELPFAARVIWADRKTPK